MELGKEIKARLVLNEVQPALNFELLFLDMCAILSKDRISMFLDPIGVWLHS